MAVALWKNKPLENIWTFFFISTLEIPLIRMKFGEYVSKTRNQDLIRYVLLQNVFFGKN